MERVAPLAHAAVPTLEFVIAINVGPTEVRSILLHTRILILAPELRSDAATRARLSELFGEPVDQGRNLRPLPWTEGVRVVPAFQGRTSTSLHVPCGYDFEVTAHKYLHAVRDGDIPLGLHFSGSVFYRSRRGDLRAERLPWDREARFWMSARTWHDLMDMYYPNSAWLRVRRDVFDRLDGVRQRMVPPTWEAALEALLSEEGT